MPVAMFKSDEKKARYILSTCGLNGLEHFIAEAIAEERERIALMVERLDNTMMHQDKLAAHIRNPTAP